MYIIFLYYFYCVDLYQQKETITIKTYNYDNFQ